MSEDVIRGAVAEALRSVVNPQTGQDVVAGGQVGELTVGADGRVSFPFSLRRGDPGSLVGEARRAAEAVEGVAEVKVDVRLPQSPPVGGTSTGGLRPGSVPAPTPAPDRLGGVTRVVAVS